jgi:nicotinic acid mononucleotide adenylyltransferase
MAIGVYPGSFNPVTTAHIAIAQAAIEQHRLDRVDLAVSRTALAKEDVVHPRFEHRIEVLERAATQHGRLAVVVTEQQLLVDISQGYDVVIVGADKWWQIQDVSWYGNDEAARDAAIAALPTVAVASRGHLAVPDAQALVVDDGLTDGVSSTAARSGSIELMAPAARRFAEATGAWVDPERYDRWLVDQADS